MRKRICLRVLNLESDNLKSKAYPGPRFGIENRKWAGIFAIVLALTVCAARVEAQQSGKVFRIGFLDPSTASGMAGLLEVFRREMHKLEWIEGKNIQIEYRICGGEN